jgi:type VI secretion system secreted protein VgrG
MEKYTQAGRPLAITTPLGQDALLLVGLTGHEGISQLFSFQLDVLADGPVAFDQLVGQPATVLLDAPGSSKRTINGILSRVTQQGRVYGRTENVPFVRYRLELVPRLWLLTRRFQSRILQHLSVPDILQQILHDEWRLDVSIRIQEHFEPRVRCVQYQETDFAFVSRLMEEEGIYYYFEHKNDGHLLIISDDLSSPPTLQEPAKLLFDDTEGGHRDQARISRWEKTQEVRPSKVTLWDHCFELPGVHLEAEVQMTDQASAGKAAHRLALPYPVNQVEMLEIYEYPGGYSHRFDGIDRNGGVQAQTLTKIFQENQRTAKVRVQQQAAQALTIDGASQCGHLEPGRQFTLDGHFDADGPYLLTYVEHKARLEGTYLGGEHDEFHYDNQFRCLPRSVPYRPPLVTPRPTVKGTQTATVVGPEGIEIHCDKYGRVKVQFHWDRTDYRAQSGGHVLHDSSCWVRVAQVWAGKGFGAIHIPRVGQEVIVDFLEGDPDKPIIVGCVYNAVQMPPYALPGYRTHSGIKTHSRSGEAGEYSHLTFEDYRDSEHVHLHSEQDMTHSAEQHLVQNVGKNHHLHVGKLAVRQVGGLPGLDHAVWIGKDKAVGSLKSTNGSNGGGGGSGGGGNGGGSNGGNGGSSSPFYQLTPNQVVGDWASSVDTVVGWRTGNTVGLYTTLKLGCNFSTTINPFAIDDFFPSASLFLGIATGGLSVLAGGMLRNALGVSNVIIGANTSIHYGRKIDVSRGPKLTDNHEADNPNYVATFFAGTLYNLLTIGELFMPMLDPAPTKHPPDSVDITVAAGGAWLTLLSLNLWTVTEVDCSQVGLLPKFGESAIVGAAISLKTTIATKWAAWDPLGFGNFDLGDLVIEGPTDSSRQTVSTDSGYTLTAPVLALLSDPDPVLNAEDPVGIIIQANGLEGTDGEVLVYGTGKATLVGGEQASVQCVTEEEVTGTVTIDCGPVGTIVLQSGLAQEPNSLQLSPEGIAIRSLLEITATVEENSISINPAMISLSSGPSSLSVTPEGITIACGPSSIAITPEGIVISGPMISISGDAMVNIG